MRSKDIVSPREKILSVAGALFFKEGFRAVGVDRLIAESDVAKATFYKHFPSKDELIAACLDRADGIMTAWMDKAVTGSSDPIQALFQAVMVFARKPECLGCTFQGTALEYPALDHPSHVIAQASKKRVLARLEDLAVEAEAARPRALAEQLYLLIEGAWASSRMFGREAPVLHLAEAARVLVRAARQ
jgi:AcrR family transcriptional regulator